MELRNGFQVAPGQCAVCATSDQSLPVIDLCQDDPAIVRRSRIYICGPCVVAMAQMVAPMMNREMVERDHLADLIADAERSLVRRDRIEELEEQLAKVAAFAKVSES